MVFSIAIATAYATQKPKKLQSTTTSTVVGYIRNHNGTVCQQGGLCSDVVGPLCTVGSVPGGTQLWGKSAFGTCIIEVYRLP